jgi:hypothetical protein
MNPHSPNRGFGPSQNQTQRRSYKKKREEECKRSWKTAEWQKNRDLFLANKYCAWHGPPVEATVPHHPRKCKTEAEYLSLKGCIPLCQTCHYAAKLRMRLCPVCKKHYFKPKHGRRKICWECFIKTPKGQQVKEHYDKHPNGRPARRFASSEPASTCHAPESEPRFKKMEKGVEDVQEGKEEAKEDNEEAEENRVQLSFLLLNHAPTMRERLNFSASGLIGKNGDGFV